MFYSHSIMSSFPPTTWSALEIWFLEFMKDTRSNATSTKEHEAQADKEGLRRIFQTSIPCLEIDVHAEVLASSSWMSVCCGIDFLYFVPFGDYFGYMALPSVPCLSTEGALLNEK